MIQPQGWTKRSLLYCRLIRGSIRYMRYPVFHPIRRFMSQSGLTLLLVTQSLRFLTSFLSNDVGLPTFLTQEIGQGREGTVESVAPLVCPLQSCNMLRASKV